MKKVIIIIIATVICSLYVSAQSGRADEVSVHVSGGYSPLLYKLDAGSKSGGMGGDFGAGYTYFFPAFERVTESGTVQRMQFGVFGGLGLGVYTAKAKLNGETAITENLMDSEDDLFEMRSTFSGYNEKQSALFLNIPIMAMYQLDMFYFLGGFKTAIPVNGKFKTNDSKVKHVGYYEQYRNSAESQIIEGFGEFDINASKGKLDLGFTVMLSLEAYMKYRLDNNLSIYYGLYFDYGLNNSLKGGNFVNYDRENSTTNSVLNSLTPKANIMAVGVKVRLAMNQWW